MQTAERRAARRSAPRRTRAARAPLAVASSRTSRALAIAFALATVGIDARIAHAQEARAPLVWTPYVEDVEESSAAAGGRSDANTAALSAFAPPSTNAATPSIEPADAAARAFASSRAALADDTAQDSGNDSVRDTAKDTAKDTTENSTDDSAGHAAKQASPPLSTSASPSRSFGPTSHEHASFANDADVRTVEAAASRNAASPAAPLASAAAPPSRPTRPTRYDALVATVAREFGLDAKLLHAMIRVESDYDANAISPKGATGLMQVIPATGARFGFDDLRDPHANLRAGATYLKWLLGEFGDDLTLALAAYNAGEGAVRKYRGRIPPYRETQDYVRQVLACYRSACPPPDDARRDGSSRASVDAATRPRAARPDAPRLTAGALLAKLGGLLLSTPARSAP